MKLNTISRRHLVAAALLAARAPDVVVRPASAALSRLAPNAETLENGPATRLLSLIPSMPFGAPATNATLSAELVAQIIDDQKKDVLGVRRRRLWPWSR